MNRQGLNGLLDAQSSASKRQQQISSGKRVLTPADDPIAAGRILQLSQELKLNTLFDNNAGELQNALEREDVALTSINQLLQRAQELVLQAGDGALAQEQRRFISIEMKGIVDSMAQQMNSRDGNGNFIFSGLNGSEQPFVKEADGRYTFSGDEGQRNIQLGPTSFVQSSSSGKRLFQEITSVSETLIVKASPANRAQPPAQIGGAQVIDQKKFSEFYPEDVIIEFRPIDEVEPPRLTYSITQVSDGRVLLNNQEFQTGQLIEFEGAAVRISGKPLPGDTFIVNSTDKKGLLATLEDFSLQLDKLTDSSLDRGTLTDEIANTLTNLDVSQTKLLEGQSYVGARLNLVERVQSTNADIQLATQASLSKLEDLDFAEAISQLTQETFILEAAQASYARISGLSLFNYL
jgi:flagellar hook-associated protein 3 FlgL